MGWLAIRSMASYVPNHSEPEYQRVQRRLLRHADRCVKTMKLGLEPQKGDEWIYHSLGLLFIDQGQFSDTEAIYEQSLQGYEKAWRLEHIPTLDTVHNLGLLYADQGRFSDAEAMYERVLRGFEKALGNPMVGTYPPALDIVENFRDLFYILNKVEETQLYYARAKTRLCIVYGFQSERYQIVVSKLRLEPKSSSSSRKRFERRKPSD